MPDADPLAISILSPGHSGHTWLCLMLGSAEGALAIGELPKARSTLAETRGCMICPEVCPEWSGFAEAWNTEENFFRAAARRFGASTIVTSRITGFQSDFADLARRRTVLLVRDGRAVTASWFRKYPQEGYAASVKRFVQTMERIEGETAAAERGPVVRYEDLLADLAAWAGLSFDPGMVRYWERRHHILGGNRGTVSFVRRHHGIPDDDESRPVDAKFYESQSATGFRDERWRSELTPADLRLFEKRAGAINRRHGYPSSETGPGGLRGVFARLSGKHARNLGRGASGR